MVSIQLGSPARGDIQNTRDRVQLRPTPSFHSIGFPCERGQGIAELSTLRNPQFPFNWVPLREGTSLIFANSEGLTNRVSIQLGSPARGDLLDSLHLALATPEVSIQLGSPARGDGKRCNHSNLNSLKKVSIQLGSPARGDLNNFVRCPCPNRLLVGFHSIGFPCERGLEVVAEGDRYGCVSIQLGSPARGDAPVKPILAKCEDKRSGFHSIGFPCERGPFLSTNTKSSPILGFHSIGFPCERGL